MKSNQFINGVLSPDQPLVLSGPSLEVQCWKLSLSKNILLKHFGKKINHCHELLTKNHP